MHRHRNEVFLKHVRYPQPGIKVLLDEAGRSAAKILDYNTSNEKIVFKPNLPYVRETMGVGGSAFDSEMLDMTFDPSLPFGVEKFKKYLRDSVFHEINHVVHYAFQKKVDDIRFWVVTEGLAVVFARDKADAIQPWSNYENNTIMLSWLNELMAATDPNSEIWFTDHPDGRSNIAYKTGAWIVDKALRNSDKSIEELTRMNYADIISIAKLH